MTTEATETSPSPVINVAEVYRILGILEQAQAETKEQLVEIKEQIVRNEERTDQRFTRNEERTEQRFTRSEERTDQRFAHSEERTDQRFTHNEERTDRQFREVNQRIDRLWYTIVGFGLVILAGIAGLAIQNALFG